MSSGITVEVSELIALQRYAQLAPAMLNRHGMRMGGHLSKMRGRRMDFAEVRHYQAGDEIRHMEWRVTARTGQPHIKLYEEERERPVVIVVDFSPSMFFGTKVAFKSVTAARLASLLAWTIVKQNDRVGGLLFSAETHHEFLPRLRKSGVLPLLTGLSQYTKDLEQVKASKAGEGRSLAHALGRLRRVAKPGSILVLISDFYQFDEESRQQVSRLRQSHDMLCYHIVDPLELKPPNPEQYAITNGSQVLLLDTRVKGIRQSYEAYCQSRIEWIKLQCRQSKLAYTQVSSLDNLPSVVRQTFPRGGRG